MLSTIRDSRLLITQAVLEVTSEFVPTETIQPTQTMTWRTQTTNLILRFGTGLMTLTALMLYLRSGPIAAGQDGDDIGTLSFQSYNDAGTPELIEYAKILAEIVDASDGTEDGKLTFYSMDAGTLIDTFRIFSGRSLMYRDDIALGGGSGYTQLGIDLIAATSSGNEGFTGFNVQASLDTAVAHNCSVIGASVTANNMSSVVQTDVTSIYLSALDVSEATGGCTKLVGAKLFLMAMGEGAVDDAIGIEVNPVILPAGSVDTVSSIKIVAPTLTGTVTDLYGIYVEDQTATVSGVNANIYSAGITSLNVFEGTIRSYRSVNDATANILEFRKTRGSAAGVIGDEIGVISFWSNNSASSLVEYVNLTAKIADETDNEECGLITYSAMISGSGYEGNLPMVYTKETGGDLTDAFEGMIVINTNDNTLKMYAKGAWRQLATW